MLNDRLAMTGPWGVIDRMTGWPGWEPGEHHGYCRRLAGWLVGWLGATRVKGVWVLPGWFWRVLGMASARASWVALRLLVGMSLRL
jgi:hypothetical protein